MKLSGLLPVFAGAALVAAMIAACGAGEKEYGLAEKRIQELSDKGVPDSLLSGAKVSIFNARTAKKLGSGQDKFNYEAAIKDIAKAEEWYNQSLSNLKPFVDSLKSSIIERKKELTGMQLFEADSMMTIVDTLYNKNWMAQAREKALALDTLMTSLLADEIKAQELKKVLVGTWSGSQKHEGEGLSAIEKKKVMFGSDGKLELMESMNGQTNPTLKEDWEFESWGTWDVKGDTALLVINREKCNRQVYQILKSVNGKDTWVKDVKPTYDSTIAGGRRDKFLTYDYIKENLKKSR